MSEPQPDQIVSGNFEFAALGVARNYRRALLKEFEAHLHGRVIEIGAGVGQITEMLLRLSAIEQLVSIEPDPRYCSEIRKHFPSHSVLEGTIDNITADANWDAILSINVLEHIREDEAELAKYQRLLSARSGTLNLFVPARQEIYSPIDRDFGHFRRYSKTGLKGKLEAAGFKVERLHYFNSVGYFAWWVTFCVLKKRQFDTVSVRLFDRMIFPLVHQIESKIIPPPIGQSLLAVARA